MAQPRASALTVTPAALASFTARRTACAVRGTEKLQSPGHDHQRGPDRLLQQRQ